MAEKINSHQYAAYLRELADFLLARDEVQFGYNDTPYLYLRYYDKELFIKAAKAFGGKKTIDSSDLAIIPETGSNFKIKLEIPRDKVCEKIQEEVWRCLPLLSQQEEDGLTNSESEDPVVEGEEIKKEEENA